MQLLVGKKTNGKYQLLFIRCNANNYLSQTDIETQEVPKSTTEDCYNFATDAVSIQVKWPTDDYVWATIYPAHDCNNEFGYNYTLGRNAVPQCIAVPQVTKSEEWQVNHGGWGSVKLGKGTQPPNKWENSASA